MPELEDYIVRMECDIGSLNEVATQAKAARLGLFLQEHVPLAVSVRVDQSGGSGLFRVQYVMDAAGRHIDVAGLQDALDRLAWDLADHDIPDLCWDSEQPLLVADLIALIRPGPGLVAALAAMAGPGSPMPAAGPEPAAEVMVGGDGGVGL
ncbi:hypothetical protein ACIGO9_29610 [Nocardia asteroides]|uniref:hypothetical protein n=1 Tax=Nocardia asteroides TaxID=1824 RepID=UPI0037C9F50F